jgi:hypothetical protein
MQAKLTANSLLVFAHFNEARAFIDIGQFETQSPGLFKSSASSKTWLLITGEGATRAGDQLHLGLNKLISLGEKPAAIFNLGVCGALDEKIALDTVHNIRTFYLAHSEGNEFHSFSTTATAAHFDCVTALHRVRTNDEAMRLRPLAQLVDREGHALARVSALHSIPFAAIKVVSDHATSGEKLCQTVADKGEHFSQLLLDYVLAQHWDQRHEDSPVTTSNTSTPIPLTVAQSHQWRHLQQAIGAEQFAALVNKLPLADWVHLRAKDQARECLRWLEHQIHPWRAQVRNQLDELAAPLRQQGIQISFDPDLERTGITVSRHLTDESEAHSMSEKLKSFDWAKLKKIMDGDWHVS